MGVGDRLVCVARAHAPLVCLQARGHHPVRRRRRHQFEAHSTCVASEGGPRGLPIDCECDAGWGGPDCCEASCEADGCDSAHGRCIAPGRCACLPGWTGPDLRYERLLSRCARRLRRQGARPLRRRRLQLRVRMEWRPLRRARVPAHGGGRVRRRGARQLHGGRRLPVRFQPDGRRVRAGGVPPPLLKPARLVRARRALRLRGRLHGARLLAPRLRE